MFPQFATTPARLLRQQTASISRSSFALDSHYESPDAASPVSTVPVSTYHTGEDPSLCEEMPVPRPRHNFPREIGEDYGTLGKHFVRMQKQLSSMIERQEAMLAAVVQTNKHMDRLIFRNDDARGMAHRRRPKKKRSFTILPHQKKLAKEMATKKKGWHFVTEGTSDDTALDATRPNNSGKSIGKQSASVCEALVHDAEELNMQQASHRRSKNSFADKDATELDDLTMLQKLFAAAESEEDRLARMEDQRRYWLTYYFSMLRSLDQQTIELVVDSLIGVVITLNAIFIGISMDHAEDDHHTWIAIDVGFSVLFLLEIGFKVGINGACYHFCGNSKYSNCFDACIILTDLIQLVLLFIYKGTGQESLESFPSASLFRIIRLGKLTRMLRLLKSSVFNDLLAMLSGMLGGMATLGWSMILFIVAIYVVALIFRELLGKGDVANVSELFDSVPRSMFTTFRCSFGDCSSSSGVPIFEYVNKDYGAWYSLAYCLFVFVITIGVFNVISAIFVESTMAAASALHMHKKKERLRDQTIWCTNVALLVRRLLEISDQEPLEAKLTESMDDVYRLEVPCSEIDELVQDPECIAALTALDIVPEDRDYLSDILDPDNGGTINAIELVEGLRRLRGDPRRSDIVTVNLMVRSVQRDVVDIAEALRDIRSHLNIPEQP